MGPNVVPGGSAPGSEGIVVTVEPEQAQSGDGAITLVGAPTTAEGEYVVIGSQTGGAMVAGMATTWLYASGVPPNTV